MTCHTVWVYDTKQYTWISIFTNLSTIYSRKWIHPAPGILDATVSASANYSDHKKNNCKTINYRARCFKNLLPSIVVCRGQTCSVVSVCGRVWQVRKWGWRVARGRAGSSRQPDTPLGAPHAVPETLHRGTNARQPAVCTEQQTCSGNLQLSTELLTRINENLCHSHMHMGKNILE